MRIAIVNDLLIEIEILRKVIKSIDATEIVWTATNGAEAIEKLNADKPDLILMNLMMPVMDGATATKIIMESNPCSIMIVTTSLNTNRTKVFDAMGYGALDVVATPVLDEAGNLIGGDNLVKKIKTIRKLISYTSQFEKKQSASYSGNKVNMVAIGSSTGGPKALTGILSNLPANLNAAIVIVQHVDSKFADGLAEWLNKYSELPVEIAVAKTKPINGRVYIAGTNDHLIIDPLGYFEYTPEPINYHYRPSVDRFFESINDNWVGTGIAVVLTGMGNDGAKGLLKLKKAGWLTIAQDESSSVVYGMPKVAAELDAAMEILNPAEIADKIKRTII
ncbi:MAG: chemotaxis-specific protein-glutamate methyltransferase CheB [Candidatus Kapabacteria bacterium]|nr:chemotaxis-specific protein-glutamate methyltransferase CheB [Candidatus Kapabacteria bacterium]